MEEASSQLCLCISGNQHGLFNRRLEEGATVVPNLFNWQDVQLVTDAWGRICGMANSGACQPKSARHEMASSLAFYTIVVFALIQLWGLFYSRKRCL